MSDARPIHPMPPVRTSQGPTGPGQRPTPPARGAAPIGGAQAPRPHRGKPDPRPMRFAIGMAGLASVTALLTAMLPSVTPSQVVAADVADLTTALGPQPSVLHVTRTVTLQPGQTAPSNSSVVVQPNPTPRIVVKTVTKQSG